MDPQAQATIAFKSNTGKQFTIPRDPIFPSKANLIEENHSGSWYFYEGLKPLNSFPPSYVREFLLRPENWHIRDAIIKAVNGPEPRLQSPAFTGSPTQSGRKVIQIATEVINETIILFALADDGTIWGRNREHPDGWIQIPSLPQPPL